MCPGRVGEGLGSGGGEGDFSPAAAAFQRDWARPRGREAGRAAGVGWGGGGEGASPGQPQAHLQENSVWESAGNSSDPSSPSQTRPFPSETVDPAGSRWWPLGAWGWLGRRS